jgi:hypothetical protein
MTGLGIKSGIRGMAALSAASTWVPLLATTAAVTAAWIVAPETQTLAQRERWSDFYGTVAQVTATLFLVIALEARFVIATPAYTRPWAALVTVGYVAAALVAAGLGMSTSLPQDAYHPVFAAAVGGATGALLSVFLIGAHLLSTAYTARELAALEHLKTLRG